MNMANRLSANVTGTFNSLSDSNLFLGWEGENFFEEWFIGRDWAQ